MNGTMKKRTVILLAGAAALCLAGGFALAKPEAGRASAAEATYIAFQDVGANSTAVAEDELLGLSAKAAEATTPGTVTAGSTLFTSYATGATYALTVGGAGSYEVAVAIHADPEETLNVNGQAVSLEGKSGNTVISQTVEAAGETVEVSYTGELCAVFAAEAGNKTLLTAAYTPGQIVKFGALLGEELENATGYYSDGSTQELKIAYENINAGSGVNVNFTTIDVSGTIEGTDIVATRYITTMPEDLIYFINCGSYQTMDSYFPESNTVDGFYNYNQTVFDYYGEQLINKVPDQSATQGGDDWGIYTKHAHNAPGDATFPYNSFVWTGSAVDGTHEMGYMLTGLSANTGYRLWIGTLSHWHGRTVNITFNGQTMPGKETLVISSSKGYTIFENVHTDASGKIDMHMTQVGDQNEPTICFIAVQKMTTQVQAVPAMPKGATLVGMEETALTLTGVEENAVIRLFGTEKPYALLYEEKALAENFAEDGTYTVDWGEQFSVSQFRVAQVTAGGTSDALTVSITDIRDFKATVETQGYTTGAVTISVEATAPSGISSWSYRLGQYGTENVTVTDRPYKLEASFSVTENGDYYIVVTSGLGVTYSESVTVSTIDAAAPALTLVPTKEGWKKGAYNFTVAVDSVAPVVEYTLYKDGKQVASEEEVPSVIALTETGEYTVTVKTAAGQSSAKTVFVSDVPATTVVRPTRINSRTLRYSFTDSANYVVRSVDVYKLSATDASKLTVTADNSMDVYEAATYVAIVTALDGTVEMFSLEVTADSFANGGAVLGEGGGSGNGSNALAIGIGVGVGGIVLAAGAVILTLMLTKKKKS